MEAISRQQMAHSKLTRRQLTQRSTAAALASAGHILQASRLNTHLPIGTIKRFLLTGMNCMGATSLSPGAASQQRLHARDLTMDHLSLGLILEPKFVAARARASKLDSRSAVRGVPFSFSE